MSFNQALEEGVSPSHQTDDGRARTRMNTWGNSSAPPILTTTEFQSIPHHLGEYITVSVGCLFFATTKQVYGPVGVYHHA